LPASEPAAEPAGQPAGVPVLRRLGPPSGWRPPSGWGSPGSWRPLSGWRSPGSWRPGGRPDALDLTWAALWLLGLACIVLYARWDAVPFHYVWVTLLLLMFGLVMRYAHRRQAVDTERARVSEENARLLAAQRRFLQDASHQLRTPITIALGHAELLARELTDSQHGRDIHVVTGELTRLKSLAERLLLIASSENPEFLHPEPVALDGFAMEVLRRWRPTAQRRWQLGRLDAVTVSADRERLGLAVDALLENAVQHTDSDDVIRLSVRCVRGCAHVIVEDSGCGIPRAELAHIFDRFRTGSGAGRPRGTGLGLAVTRAIAHGHGGEVLVRSTPGSGSTFEFVLPAPTVDPAAASGIPAQVTRATHAAT
jgi:signal transduction histidine kinase